MCPIPAAPAGQRTPDEPRALNDHYHRRLHKRLRDNPAAITYLQARGLTAETIEHFGLGLALPYTSRRTRRVQADALVYPVIGFDGSFYAKYGYYNIPGVTQAPEHPVAWAHGEARACYAEAYTSQRSLFICARADELWLMWQAIQNFQLAAELLLATTTHGAALPVEWTDKEFWQRWEYVYCSYPVDELSSVKVTMLARASGRYIARVPPPGGDPEQSTFAQPHDPEILAHLLKEALVVSPHGDDRDNSGDFDQGRLPYEPININGAYLNGHLYYPMRVLRREAEIRRSRGGDETARYVERLETIVVKSDRTTHTALHAPAPRGTATDERVLRLTDGTLIERVPRPNRFSTWSWASIKDYLAGRGAARPLGQILSDVLLHLKASVVLPRAEDYALLALTVPVTYAQAIFDCVPLLFITGPADSGKSRLGRALAGLCANAVSITPTSFRSAAQIIDEARGLTVVDNLDRIIERLSAKSSELLHALLRGYDKAASLRHVLSYRATPSIALNLYGMKIITSQHGLPQVPAAAAIQIRTQRMPVKQADRGPSDPPLNDDRLARLRDELHTWTFEYVAAIASAYHDIYSVEADLFQRVAAPLRAMAALSADETWQHDLEAALAGQARRSFDGLDPQGILRRALTNLLREGYTTISVTHLTLEMRRLLAEAIGTSFSDGFPGWTEPEWAGRMAHRLGLIDPRKAYRARLHGTHLRFYVLNPALDDEAFRDVPDDRRPAPKGPTDFCGECSACPFSSLGCPIMINRR